MNRDSVSNDILSLSNRYNNILVQLPTGFGKTKVALDLLSKYHKSLNTIKVLIVVPRNVLKENWAAEIKKWNMNITGISYTFTTYVSLPKYAGKWDFMIFDEAHHLSERCREALTYFTFDKSILLSATIKKPMLDGLYEVFDNLYNYRVKIKEAIENEVLPDPKVYLIPLELGKYPTESIYKNPKGSNPMIEVSWKDRWAAIKQKKYKVRIYCSEQQYYEDLSSQIEWFKGRYMRTRNELFKNRWLRLAGDRLKWLSDKKMNILITLKTYLKNERVLIFCNSIEQTETLGNCVNSKSVQSAQTLEDFNSGKINQISAVNILNEGMNLTNCRIGIYGNLNSSEIIVKQRLGRILRHKNPVIIIPYYKNTREEELVQKMLEDYNTELIKTINGLNELQL